ncbi:MAG TPA: VWA domain-containing protein [Vicinamibacterales bacterium]|nr:VWA domain-containing protein [Vicinamibacterales bacterium]
MRLLSLLCCLSGSVAIAGFQQPTPTFRSGVDLVPVDVGVIGRDGRPVKDLSAADFTLTVDGRPRAIVSASYVSTERLEDTPPDPTIFSTNSGQRPGRLIALVIDEAHIKRGTARTAFTAAASFVRGLGRSDRVALYLIPGTGALTGFTSNHALVLRLLERASGQALEAEGGARVGIAESFEILDRPPNPDRPNDVAPGSLLEEVLLRECAGENDPTTLAICRRRVEAEARQVFTMTKARSARSLLSLRGIFDQLAATAESKTVVLLTEGLILDRDAGADVAWVGPLASRAQVQFYALRLSGDLFDAGNSRISPSRRADQDLLSDGLDRLVGAARGTVFPIAVNATAVFSRLDVELSGYYLLSFAPLPGDRDGAAHRIDVRTSRAGVRIRARREFSVEAARPRTRQEFLLDALKSPLGLTDFGLSATTFQYQDAASGRIKVLVAVTIDRTFNRDGDFSLAWYLTDTKGHIVSIQDEQKLSLPSPQSAGRPQTFSSALLADPGVYSLTIAAVDDEGRRATVEHGFEARLSAVGQLRLSDLLLAEPPATGRTVSPSVDGRITADTVVAYMELYSAAEPQLGMATLTLEVARDEDGRALETAPMRFVGTDTRGVRFVEGSVPVALLADGQYVARAVLASQGRPLGKIVRPFTLARASARPVGPTDIPVATFAVRIDPFNRVEVLSRPAVGFFLDHLRPAGLPELPAPLIPALGLSRAGRFEEARAIVERANVTHYAAPFFSGLAALALGDLDRAAGEFSASLKAAPDFLPARFYLGACYASAGRDHEAAIAWRGGLMADTRAPWIYTSLIDSLLRTRDVRPAMEVLADATNLWPDSDDIRVRLGTAQALSGQAAAAVRTFIPFLERHADDKDRLLLALRMLYESRAANTTVESLADDRARFDRYAAAYEKAGGTALDQVAAWRKIMD